MNPEMGPPSNRIGGVHFRLKFPAMKKSELHGALQTEIQKHNLSTFMHQEHKVVLTGCSFCRKHFGTVEQFKFHITDDVLPSLLDKLSVEAK
jgi:reverse gyrase